MTIFKGKIFILQNLEIDPNSNWIAKCYSSTLTDTSKFKIGLNILTIIELIQAQLTGIYGFDSKQALQSEIHKSVMKILNSKELNFVLSILTVHETIEYTIEQFDADLAEQAKQLSVTPGARNSWYKNVIPSLNMSSQSLLKYRIGYKFSLIGKFQTHPIYYSNKLSENINMSLESINEENLKDIVPFPDLIMEAISFVRNSFSLKETYSVDKMIEISDLYKLVNINFESSKINLEEIQIPNTNNATEEEKARFKKIEEKLKSFKNKKNTSK